MSNQLDVTVAKRLDITVKENQTFNPIITILDNDGNPFNVSDSKVKLSVRQQGCGCDTCAAHAFDGFDVVYKQDFVPVITGSEFNILEFFDTIKLSNGTYKYDLLAEFSDGMKIYLLTGTFKVKKSYTKI